MLLNTKSLQFLIEGVLVGSNVMDVVLILIFLSYLNIYEVGTEYE